MEAFLAEFGSESLYLESEGRVIRSEEETLKIFGSYLEDLGV